MDISIDDDLRVPIPYIYDDLRARIFASDNCSDIIKICSANKINCSQLYNEWILKDEIDGIPLNIVDLPNTYTLCDISANLEKNVYNESNPTMTDEQLEQVMTVTNANCNRFYNRCKYLTSLKRIKLDYDIIDLPVFSYNEIVGIDSHVEFQIFDNIPVLSEQENPIICCQFYRGRWGIIAFLEHDSWFYTTTDTTCQEEILIEDFMNVNNIDVELSNVVSNPEHPILKIIPTIINDATFCPKIHDVGKKQWNELTNKEKEQLAIYRINTEELWNRLTITTGDKILVKYEDLLPIVSNIPFWSKQDDSILD